MRFYYTGAITPNDIQRDPFLSLGGYVSQNPVPNDIEGSLFSEISQINQANSLKSHRLICLRNTTQSLKTGVKIHSLSPSPEFAIQLALVMPLSTDPLRFDQISMEEESPLSIDFSVADAPENALVVGDLEVDESIGVWLRRISKKRTSKSFEELKLEREQDAQEEPSSGFKLVIEYI